MQEIFDKLCAEFPREQVRWRAQQVNKDGTSAMALAYIDARDVMDRLDAVCGPDGWQSEHYAVGSKTACKIGLKKPTSLPDDSAEWIWKSDGAGDTAVEADKGAMSDAFKRAAVHWGIGRYLYDFPVLWIPCESYKRNDGKYGFKEFKVDPWGKIAQYWHGPLSRVKLQNTLKECHHKLLTETDGEDSIDQLELMYSDAIGQARKDLPTWLDGDDKKGGLLAAFREQRKKIAKTLKNHREFDQKASVA